MKILKKYRLGKLLNNCYLIELNQQVILIDAPEGVKKAKKFLDESNLTLNQIWITHTHYDHFLGLSEMVDLYPGVDVYAPAAEILGFTDPKINLSFGKRREVSFEGAVYPFEKLKPNKELKIKYISGHSIQSAIFIFEKEKIIFSGDTLFFETVGRSDLLNGDSEKLLSGIMNEILCYDEKFKVYPGHGFETNTDYEKKNNPYVIDYV